MPKPKCTCGQTHNAKFEQSENGKLRNPLKLDPSRTITLRKKFVTEFWKRFQKLKGEINKLIIEED